jgi:hypothetical protein
MSDRVAKAQAAADKWAAKVEERRAHLAALQATAADSRRLDKAAVSLAKAEARLMAVRAKLRKALNAAAGDASMLRRLDRIAELAPATMQRWKYEREQEPKRIEKRKKHLKRVTTKDLRNDPTHRRDRRSHKMFGVAAYAAPVEAATFPSGPIIPYTPPPSMPAINRPGLLAGDYRLIDKPPSDIIGWRAPKEWTAEYVGSRMVEAHSTLRRLPMTTRPKEFGGIWPEYRHEGVELAYQAGSGTLFVGKRTIMGTAGAALSRTNEALAWILEFLADQPVYARAVNVWASSHDVDDDIDGFVREALEFIAAKLNAKKAPVT